MIVVWFLSWLFFREHAKFEKILQKDNQATWKAITGLEGERSNEKFEPITMCATSTLYLC